MKKWIVSIVVLLMVSLLAMPVFAAQTASVTLSASKTSLQPGDTFSVTVNITTVEKCSSGGFMFYYDEKAFEYVEGSALVSGFALSGISTANNKLAGYFMSISGGETVKGDIFRVTFKVKDNASGSYTISGNPSMQVGEDGDKNAVSCTVSDVTVTVGSATQSTQPAPDETTAPEETVAPTESVDTPSTNATEAPTVDAPNTEATEAPVVDATDATAEATDAIATVETEASTEETTEPVSEKDTEEAATESSEVITIGATTPAVEKTVFPWWIIFAVTGIGAIVAIVIFMKKS